MKKVSKNITSCTQCLNRVSKADLVDSGSRICNTCFAPYKAVIALKKAAVVFYTTPDEIKGGSTEEMEVVRPAYLRGDNTWMITVRKVGSKNIGTDTYVKYVKVK
jgi:hypothetical protein